MTIIALYDPVMCCSTGIRGTDITQHLTDLAADLDWLNAQGVTVQRFGLSRETTMLAANDIIRQTLQDIEGDDLPMFMVGGILKAKARYPSRVEQAVWADVSNAPAIRAPKASSCCSALAGHTAASV